MNPEDLKTGDLVRVIKDDYIITKGTICKVIGVNAIDLSAFGGHKPVVSLSTVNKEEEIRSMSCENIEGIPLTKKILFKNGWKRSKVSDCEYYYKDGLFLSYTLKDNKFRFNDFDYSNCVLVELPYVHNLQHLLFGLGLNSSMIV